MSKWRDETKECTRCKMTKPLSEFYKRASGYYLSECKECSKIIQKESYKKLMQNQDYRKKNLLRVNEWSLKNPKKVSLNKMNYYNRKKKGVLDLLGNHCFICGEIPKRFNCHEIHGKKHPQTWAYILGHVEDFILLCNKCHGSYHRFLKFKEKFKELGKLGQMA